MNEVNPPVLFQNLHNYDLFQATLESISLSIVLKPHLDKQDLTPLLDTLIVNSPNQATRDQVRLLAKRLEEVPQQATLEQYQQFCVLVSDLKNSRVDVRRDASICDGCEPVSNQLVYEQTAAAEVLESFRAEAVTHLQTVEQNLLHLEANPRDKEALNAVFGAMHSLKGVSGFLGLATAQALTHEAESIVDLARKRPDGIRSGECDCMLRVKDVLAEIVARVMAHAADPSQELPRVPETFGPVREELSAMASAAAAGVLPDETLLRSTVGTSSVIAPEPKGVQRDSLRRSAGSLVRVQVEKLDGLIDTIGELVVTQSQIHQDPMLRSLENPTLFRNLSQLNKITRELQAVAMSLRMYPLREAFSRVTRIARDLAKQEGKEIELFVHGADTEMDKNLIEAVIDPLTHLVRNAVDHGVDLPGDRQRAGKPRQARIELSARHQGGNVIIEVSDDGKGMDLDRILEKARALGLAGVDEKFSDAQIRNFVFEPGFSTAETITEVSGRGVGLDVVKRNVLELGGRVSVSSAIGRGTTFELIVPLTLAIIDGLIVRVGGECFIVPVISVLEALRPTRTQVSTVQGRGELVDVRGAHLPMVRLSEFAGIAAEAQDPWKAIVMIVECDGTRCGLMVDELMGQQQVVIKTLGDRFRGVRGISGGAILGDGRVGLILDVAEVLASSRLKAADAVAAV